MRTFARSSISSLYARRALFTVAAALITALMAVSASAGELDLTTCELPGVDGARCGSLSLPENSADPKGRHIDLRIVVLDATGDSPKKDPIFYLAGGPGTAASDLAPVFARSPLREDRAFVLVDQRGTGGSHPLHCAAGDFAEALQSMFSFDLSLHAAECAEKLSATADLRFYGTPQIADDIDAVRRALGASKINLLGGSYGTRVALHYLRAYGEHARTAILRGVAGPEIRVPLGFSRSSLAALRSLATDCKADEACGNDFPDLEASVRKLRARLDAEPIIATVKDPETGKDLKLSVGGDELVALLHYQLYGTQLAARIPAMVKAAEKGDVGPAIQVASTLGAQLLPRFHFGSFLAIICSEDAPFYDEADVAAASGGSLLRGAFARGILASCEEWPEFAVAEEFKKPVESDVPVLLISGEADPVTPSSDAAAASRHLSNSVHLVLAAVGHFGTFPGCSGQRVTQFLEQGSVEGLEASCASDLERPAFAG